MDDTGLPDTPDGGGHVLFVPVTGETPDPWAALGIQEPPPAEAPYARVAVESDGVVTAGALMVPVDDGGHFTPPAPGTYLVCRIPSGSSSTRGCDEAEIADGEPLTLSWGEGGFGATTGDD